jgi:hypothetical protein
MFTCDQGKVEETKKTKLSEAAPASNTNTAPAIELVPMQEVTV